MYWRELHSSSLWDGVSTPPASSIIIEEGRKQSLEALKNYLEGKTVLEIGAGKGFYTEHMRKWGYRVLDTDITYEKNKFYDVTTEPMKKQFDNVIAIGVLHHIIDDNDFYKSLKNIFKMAKKRIVLGVKLGDNPEIPIAKQRPVEAYAKIFGKPILIKDAKYLTMLVFE
jgi:SAM-dependent methyltransferase